MALPITTPKLGWGTEPVTLAQWKVKEGSWVERGSSVLAVETAKITSEVEAEQAGFLHIVVEEGKEAAIGSVVGFLAETKEELATLQKESPAAIETTPIAAQEAPPAEAVSAPEVKQSNEGGHLRISPVARKLAEENLIDITGITGTGPEGRIVREDIEKAIAAGQKPKAPLPVSQGKQVKSTIPLRGMRKVIAEHMQRSLSVSAQLTSMGEIDMTEAVKLRESLVSRAETMGARITYTDIFVFIVARLLKKYPIINSSLTGDEIKLWENINVGVAVALEEGLIVPVIKDADQKSLVEISQNVKSLAEKARSGQLVPDDVSGGTFTISNLGALSGGYRFETVIINQPESAILGTGGISDRAVVRDRQIVIRPIMTYYFTYDHRVVNGATAAGFMADVTRFLEMPGLMLFEE